MTNEINESVSYPRSVRAAFLDALVGISFLTLYLLFGDALLVGIAFGLSSSQIVAGVVAVALAVPTFLAIRWIVGICLDAERRVSTAQR